ncbi:hypothetical protein BDD12DRAFT_880041 [Trichophaea hybrida]|nr:hypothetical protein BDD12DRAFT_880041 [Trichophaea hybrida]
MADGGSSRIESDAGRNYRESYVFPPPVGAIVGGIVGGVIAFGIIIAVALVIFRRRQIAKENGEQNEKGIPMPMSDDDSESKMRAWNPSRGGSTPLRPRISIPETAIAVPIPPPTSPTLQVFSPLSTHYHRDFHAPSENVFSPLSTHHHGDDIVSPTDNLDHSAQSSVTFSGPPRLSLDLGSPVSPVDKQDKEFNFSSLRSGTAITTHTTHTIARKPVPHRE